MKRAKSRFGRWLQRLLDADPRYICWACDDRFVEHRDGVEHVLRCHPEFSSLTLDGDVRCPVASHLTELHQI